MLGYQCWNLRSMQVADIITVPTLECFRSLMSVSVSSQMSLDTGGGVVYYVYHFDIYGESKNASSDLSLKMFEHFLLFF